jgi:hypothetical protein
MLTREIIPTLRIGDENTLGLRGQDDERQLPFFRLLRGQGYSKMQGRARARPRRALTGSWRRCRSPTARRRKNARSSRTTTSSRQEHDRLAPAPPAPPSARSASAARVGLGLASS